MKTNLLKNRTTSYVVLFLILLNLVSCLRNNEFTPTLPDATTIGANTFGCYADGILITPRDGTGTFGLDDEGMEYWSSPSSFSYNEIDVEDFKKGNSLRIHIIDIAQNGEGTFPIKEGNCHKGVDANQTLNIYCVLWDETHQKYKWYCSIEDSGFLTITRFDFDNRILSGTFYCRAVNRDDATDIIEITQGRFDIKWDVLNNGEVSFP